MILLPVYAASEAPLPGGTSEDLYAAFRRLRPALRVLFAASLDEAWHAAAAGLASDRLLLVAGPATWPPSPGGRARRRRHPCSRPCRTPGRGCRWDA